MLLTSFPSMQVVVVYVVQHLMLVGLTLPFKYIALSPHPWTPLDSLSAALAVGALLLAAHADNILFRFVSDARRRGHVLRQGAWAHSRHPNHLAEQLWWWALWLFAVPAGGAWTVVGTAFNSVCVVQVCFADGLHQCNSSDCCFPAVIILQP